ncbi:hypothetical protein Purlil1_7035 [Purpureocillium lilacinum]|uniref:Uncharacterized protein n=1 Tax=Purpureocillium lilacinum TaxID=33203 RepID=A0ABR0BWJ7_PURLI|nr:hypothetical protein Purlil1_7035 [Purpureocillium lilacinum]
MGGPRLVLRRRLRLRLRLHDRGVQQPPIFRDARQWTQYGAVTVSTRPVATALHWQSGRVKHGASRTRRKSCYCTPRARTQCRIRIARAITPSLLSVLDETAVHAASNDDTRAASQPMERRNVSQPKSTARPFPAVATLSSVGPVQGLAEPSNVVPSPGAIFSRGLWLPATAHLRSATSAPIAALR